MVKTNKHCPFLASLKSILKRPKDISIKEIFSILSEYGAPACILIFTLPLCFPLQIPGMSTPFGLLVSLLGIQMGFRKRLWLPKWILRKKPSKKILDKVIKKTASIFSSSLFKPRLSFLAKNIFFIKFNSVLIFILALVLALPIPIPMINLVSALPIICLGIGLLKNDGLCILIGYFLTFLCFLFFSWLILFGFNGIKNLL